MLVTALAREREQTFQNGLREGKQEGLHEGEQKGRIEMAQLMLAKGIEMLLISEVTNLPKAQLLQLREEVVVMVRKAIALTASKREKEQTFQNGLYEGKEERLFEGEQKDRIETAKVMLAKGMEIPLISEITDLPEAQLLNLTEELVFTVKVMRLLTVLKRKREQTFQNGLREGKQKGLLEGEQKGIFETAKAMLARGMEISLISEITDLPEAQLLQLKDGLSSMKN